MVLCSWVRNYFAPHEVHISRVMYISGAMFEEHCFNITRDILYSIPFQLDTSWRHHFPNLHNTKNINISEIFQKGKRHSFEFLCFYFSNTKKLIFILYAIKLPLITRQLWNSYLRAIDWCNVISFFSELSKSLILNWASLRFVSCVVLANLRT